MKKCNPGVYFLVILVLSLVLFYFIKNKEGLWYPTSTDYPGNDISSYSNLTVKQCMDTCNITPNCKGIVTNVIDRSTTEGVGNCWLKSDFKNAVSVNYDRYAMQKY
uniref:Apple domain-containing protein n=1 Tax=viral metagenome TaxID=1070528 RepID=A0A6C0D1S0_9ZZZZ